jgi:hypothetical protein
MDLFKKIDVVKNISPEEFHTLYFKKQKPVVIKGLTDNTFAGANWSIDYFKDTMGDTVIDLFDNNKKNPGSAHTTPDLKMKLRDFLTIISKDEPTGLRIFLYNMFKHNPQLKKEFPCPKLFKGVLDTVGYMFFGGKNTTVRIHYDIDMSNVLHTHFEGRKRVVLIPPEYTKMLYCLPLNTYSLIDPGKPDYKQYPALQFIKGYDFIIEPGDSVFMPSGYWHYMTYLEGGFSVSYRKISPSLSTLTSGFLNLCIYLPIDKLLNKIPGNKWLETKKQIAEIRADWAIEKKYLGTHGKSFPSINKIR